MKKLLSIILLTFIFAALTFTVQAEIDSGEITPDIIWEFNTETGEFKITGIGEMPNDLTEYIFPPWEDYKSSIKTVIISEYVENIGQYAFYECKNLESVIIPASVASIGKSAFEFCENLRSVTFKGNAPKLPEFFEVYVFFGTPENFTVYYYEGTAGWESSDWNDYTMVMIPTVKTDLSSAEVEFEYDISSLTYTGSAIKPTVLTVKIGEDEVLDTEYAVTYGENIYVNKGGSITITAVDDSKFYCGSKTVNFTINPKTLAVESGTYTVAKEYDGTDKAGTAIGELGLDGVVTGDTVTVKAITIGAYPDVNAGIYSVTLSDLELDGKDMDNYTLSDNTYTINNAKIIPADYTYDVEAMQDIKVGSGLPAINAAPASGTGVELPGGDFETVNGTLKWYTDDETSMEAQDTVLSGFAIGESVTLWWSFTANNPNYTGETKTGATVFKIIKTPSQTIEFDTVINNAVNITYGDIDGLCYPATLSDGTGTVAYSSNDTSVATVDNAGTLKIFKAGTTTITATAAAVPGLWAETSVSYELTVNPKPITEVSIKITGKDNGVLCDGDILTAVVSGLAPGDNEESADTLSFKWNGIKGSSTDKYYIINGEASNTQITVTVTASGNYSGSVTSGSVTVVKTPDEGDNPVTDILCGDINGDGKVNIADLICLSRHIARIEEITAPDLLGAAKVNGYIKDDEIGPAELVRLAQWIAEINLTPLGQSLD